MRNGLARLTGGSPGAMRTGGLDRGGDGEAGVARLHWRGRGASVAGRRLRARADPKDMIGLFNRLRRQTAPYATASSPRHCRSCRTCCVTIRATRSRSSCSAAPTWAWSQYRQAIQQYRAYLALVPTSSYAHQWIAICQVRLSDQDEALREAAAALAIDPRFTDSRVLRGGILASRGQYNAALAELRAAVDTDPEKPMVRLDLAKVLAEAGPERGGRSRVRADSLLDSPTYPAALTGLGALRAGLGQLDEAGRLLRRSLKCSPPEPDARFNLARVLEQQGRSGGGHGRIPARGRRRRPRRRRSGAAARDHLRRLRILVSREAGATGRRGRAPRDVFTCQKRELQTRTGPAARCC